MNKHHSCINTLAVIKYFEEHAPGLLDELLEDLGPEIDGLPDPKGFLMDPNNWISGWTMIKLYENAKRLLGPEVVFEIGYDSVLNKHLENSFKEHLLKATIPWKIVENTINELESDKELIKKKYDEIHTLNIKLKSKVDQLLSLQDVSSAVLSTLDPDCLFEVVLQQLVKVARLDRAAIFIVDEDKQVLSLVHAVGVKSEDLYEVMDYSVPLSKMDNIIARAAANKEPLFIHDVEGSALNKNNLLIRKFRPKAVILVPLAAQGRLLGVLVGDQEHPGSRPFPDPEFLTSFANQIAMALNNTTLYRKLSESEKRYRELVENAHDGIWILDEKDKLTLANTRISEMFQGVFSLGRSVFELIAEENKETVEMLLQQNKAGLVGQSMMELQRGDGQISLLVSSVPIMKEGTYAGSFATVTDVSEMKRLERQLYQAQKMECLGTMAGGIAHDFNNILTSILGYTALLKLQLHGAEAEKYVEIIEKSSLRAADLVKEILTFSRGGQVHTLVSVDVNRIVSETIKLLSNVVDKRIRIEVDLERGPITIQGDATQFQQAVLNVALNARDAMPEGGMLGIRTENCSVINEYDAESRPIPPGEYVKVSISDNGTGIEEKDVHKIFDPFFTTKPVGKGTGLGLAIVHGIVKGLKGHIRVDSRIGSGTTFELLFPSAKNESKEKEAALLVPNKMGHGETILLVDDEQSIRDLGTEALTLYGFKTLSAGDGLEAVSLFRAKKEAISLVILDLVMPNLSGKDTLKRLKEIDPAVKIIISTGYVLDKQEVQELQSEVDGFVQKPFAFAQLVQLINDSLKSETPKT